MLVKHGKMPSLTKFDNGEFNLRVTLYENSNEIQIAITDKKTKICLIQCYCS